MSKTFADDNNSTDRKPSNRVITKLTLDEALNLIQSKRGKLDAVVDGTGDAQVLILTIPIRPVKITGTSEAGKDYEFIELCNVQLGDTAVEINGEPRSIRITGRTDDMKRSFLSASL